MSEQENPQEQPAVQETKFIPALCSSTINKLPQQLQGLKNCFALPFDAFRKAFVIPQEADRVMAKEIDFASQAMVANPYLIQVASKNPTSLVNALKNVALAGSTLNPVLKQGYLVPFNGAITFMPSYMGLVDVLVNNGLVRKIEAHCVYNDDEFEIKLGTGGYLKHVPNCWGSRTKENLKGAYYFVVMTDGTEMFDTMSVDEIEVIRKRAPSSKSSSPWDTDYAAMCAKTLVRRAFKMIPKSNISNDKLKTIEALFDYDEKVEKDWIERQKKPHTRVFEEEEESEYIEVEE